MTCTTGEAAVAVGVSEATIRQWVRRGHLAPVRAGAKPLRYLTQDVVECQAQRVSQAEQARLDTLTEAWLAR